MIDNAGDDPIQFRLVPMAEPMSRLVGARLHFDEVPDGDVAVRVFSLVDADADFLNGIQCPYEVVITEQVVFAKTHFTIGDADGALSRRLVKEVHDKEDLNGRDHEIYHPADPWLSLYNSRDQGGNQ